MPRERNGIERKKVFLVFTNSSALKLRRIVTIVFQTTENREDPGVYLLFVDINNAHGLSQHVWIAFTFHQRA